MMDKVWSKTSIDFKTLTKAGVERKINKNAVQSVLKFCWILKIVLEV